jgi:hypothetical protein
MTTLNGSPLAHAEDDHNQLQKARGSMTEVTMDRSQMSHDVDPTDVQRRAYERYEARGREDGRDQEDWYAAEQDLRNATTEEAPQRMGEQSPTNR